MSVYEGWLFKKGGLLKYQKRLFEISATGQFGYKRAKEDKVGPACREHLRV